MGVPQSPSFAEVVRQSADIVRLIAEYVPLKPAGARHKGLCPFHQEKTPSFSVDPRQQMFFCFGCHKGGDVFTFVMEYEKLGFREAVELVARKCGIPVPETAAPGSGLKRRVIEMNRAAQEHWAKVLADPERGRPARAYLERRGVTSATVSRLGLGYAQDSWDSLLTHLRGRGFRPSEIVTAGLAAPRKERDGHYDRFRHRLMFPIRDAGGRPVAFGGRTLGDAEAKYVNSPETPAYVKGEHLYGLDLAAESIRRQGHAVVVEGYLDLAAVLQAGIENVVASLGTALTAAQARLLSRYTQTVVMSFDGDSAGTAATIRSIDLLLERDFNLRVLELPPGKDPDDVIRSEGPESYARRLAAAPGFIEHLIRSEASKRDLSRPAEQAAAIDTVLPRLARMPNPFERAAWAAKMADALRVEDSLLLQELKAAVRAAKPAIRSAPVPPAADAREAEKSLVSALLRNPRGASIARERLDAEEVRGLRIAPIVEALRELGDAGRPTDVSSVFGALGTQEDRDLLSRIAARDDPEPEDAHIEACLRALRRDRLVKEGRELQREIETTEDPAVLDALLRRKQQLGRQIDDLSHAAPETVPAVGGVGAIGEGR